MVNCLRLFGVIFPAILVLFLILRARYDGDTSDIRYATVAGLLFAPTLLIGLPKSWLETATRPSRWWRFVWLVPIVLVFPITVVSLVFGTVDVAAFVFHWVFGTKGTPWLEVSPFIITALVYWGIIAVTLIRLEPLLPMARWALVAVGAGILAINPLVTDTIANKGWAYLVAQESLVPHYVEPKLRANTERPNIVLVYIEGLEQTYEQEDAFGDVYAPISRLRELGVSFVNVDQVAATGWSLAGTVASQCGIPLVLDGIATVTEQSESSALVPRVQCLSDMTAAQGYANAYMSATELVGENEGYFGFVNFFDAHGAGDVYDRADLAELRGEAGRSFSRDEGWGYRDDVLFEHALDKLSHLQAGDAPYFLTLATMDTHGPRAFRPERCLAEGEAAVTDDILDSVRCTAALAEEFIKEVMARTAGTNTRIIVLSDHLAHRSSSFRALKRFERRNTVLFIDPEMAGKTVAKQGSMLDVYPTILDWLDWVDADADAARAGLGVSLFSDPPTLVEQFGKSDLDSRIMTDIDLSSFLWSDPANDVPEQAN